jgi:hypothetical protein
MAVWTVAITGVPALFIARNQPTAPIGTLFADPDDLVSWDNQTDQPHQLRGTGLSFDVEPGDQTAAWNVPKSGPITYRCALHSSEVGTIQVNTEQSVTPSPDVTEAPPGTPQDKS